MRRLKRHSRYPIWRKECWPGWGAVRNPRLDKTQSQGAEHTEVKGRVLESDRQKQKLG